MICLHDYNIVVGRYSVYRYHGMYRLEVSDDDANNPGLGLKPQNYKYLYMSVRGLNIHKINNLETTFK